MPVTPCTTASIISGPARFVIPFADSLIRDIDAGIFADRFGTTINHPAFVLGHLAYYAGVCVQLLGGEIDLLDADRDLYQHGVECREGSGIYPAKDDLVAFFNQRVHVAADFIDSCDEAVFAKSSEETPFADRLPNMGSIASFMLEGHMTFHLGQISAWRRVAGLGPTS